MFKKTRTLFISLGLILFVFNPLTVNAAFNPNMIISDEEFLDAYSLTVTDVQNFLARQKGTLASKTIQDFNKVSKPVSQAIVEIAQAYGINPKVILATLQKESSLITNPNPSQTAINYAMGYGCPDRGGCSSSASGIYRQMDYAIWQFRCYINSFVGNCYNPNTGEKLGYHYWPGGTYTFSDVNNTRITTVTIQNKATASLYNYTPHVYNGNYNFYTLYNQWFAKIYPDGSLVRVGKSGGVWLIQNGMRRAFQNRAAFITRYGDFSKVLQITQDQLENYPRGTNISLPNYSLVQTPDLKTYLLSGDEKRLISSQDVFRNLGFNPEEVIPVSFDDVADYLNGIQISSASAYPAGALVKIKENGAVTYIENGIWYPILDKTILKSRFSNRKVTITITEKELLSYQKGEALKLKDGELVQIKGEAGVCVISNGLRRCITSQQMFKQYGFNKKNIIVISPRIAELHPLGEKLGNNL